MDALQYLQKVGGVARTGQLLAAGYSRTDVARLPTQGAGQPRRGVFMLKDCRAEFAAAIRNNAKVTCASAAGHYGLWLRRPPERHHLACNHGHGSGFVRHRTVRFDGDPTLPVAGVEDAVIHSLGCLEPNAAAAMAVSAVRLHGVPLALLREELSADKSRPALVILQELDLRAESIVEVDAQYLFKAHGIGYDAQVQLPGIGRVDFLIEGMLIVEVDGFAFHADRASLRRDLFRNNASTLKGFSVLRYPPEAIWYEPGRVIAEIRAVLKRLRDVPPRFVSS
ncbi:DUF559 domain-containing protein [Arthrobacter sp. StoSoilB20]|uniref:endonuclease domain-containing protein n=1 Tax=Arthrobacter sp. StoSoilB20 TaxID=2830995 RepID=UPI001CC6ACF0|nr:DUF559 domain-containing protein [Arthrobacter sp. StoSoilB20]